ncbi:MAG: dehypoxanthine futalosine cyclase [Gemmatimonadetes bacterium]|nr:dehypoxanthine futalosine cyclase [Gemmatimonadota bacterium]
MSASSAPSLLDRVHDKIVEGERLNRDEAVSLFQLDDLTAIGALADMVRRRLHPEPIVTYIVDRNINYTNVCDIYCKFCAFFRPPDHNESYLLPHERVFEKIERTLEQGGVQILLQGGVHPELGVEYFEELFEAIKARYPIHIHGLSPVEIIGAAEVSEVSVSEALRRLAIAGLDSIPGGGAEILAERVRRKYGRRKGGPDKWLDVMEEAHHAGLRTTATMMFGGLETLEERIEHLERVRNLQDLTGGFTAFISWTLQPDNTLLEGKVRKASAHEYLKMLALSRLFIDNIRNFQVSFVTMGAKIGQTALSFGGNDFGSLMLEENVVAAAGTECLVTQDEIEHLIKATGRFPRRRNMFYEIIDGRGAVMEGESR